jgi:hypothetical protein
MLFDGDDLLRDRANGDPTMSKTFLAVGDHLLNPYFIVYAIVEGPQLRVGLASGPTDGSGELRFDREEASEVLRWLRLNSEFLSRNGGFGSRDGSLHASIQSSQPGIPSVHGSKERSAPLATQRASERNFSPP